ncbi:MAG TPA: hypothetical protein VFV84_16530 [Burkholderiales bacterium]|nr:hypothetical protein [Burkholderiales bacterium]
MTLLLSLLLALPAAGADQTDDPMIRWDCDRAESRLVLEMVRPPVPEVSSRETLILSGARNFLQCPLDGATWTLLVDLVEYDSGPCEPEPDTIVSLLRNEKLVLSRVPVSRNCLERPVLAAMRIVDAAADRPPLAEVCAAPGYGEAPRCTPLDVDGLEQPLEGAAIAARAAR